MIDKITEFVWNRYIYFHSKVTKKQVRDLLENYSNQVIIVKDKNEIFGLAFYLKLTDKTFLLIQNRILDITDTEIAKKLLQEKGDNIHFVFLVANGIKTIMKGLREIMNNKKIKSISWFSPDMKKLFIRRIKEVELCHQ